MDNNSQVTSELEEMTKKWMSLERKTLKQREAADEFYEKKLMKLIRDDYVQRNADKVYEKVEYLVMSVGTSYEPLVLNISLLQPEKILFLCTSDTEKYLDKVVQFCKLPIYKFQKTIVSETDPNDIYREIKNSYRRWGRPLYLKSG